MTRFGRSAIRTSPISGVGAASSLSNSSTGYGWPTDGGGWMSAAEPVHSVRRPGAVRGRIRCWGFDPSEGFVAWTAAHIDDRRARFEVGSAASLPPASADVVVSGLVLDFLPDPAAAVARMRAAAPDGILTAHVWDAAVALDQEAAQRAEGVRFDSCRPEPLELLWRDADCTTSRSEPSRCQRPFPTSTATGSPFVVGRAQRRRTRCRWMTQREPGSTIGFATICRPNPTARSDSWPAPGRCEEARSVKRSPAGARRRCLRFRNSAQRALFVWAGSPVRYQPCHQLLLVITTRH